MGYDRDLYEVLQVSRQADTTTIRAAALSWKRRTHPDHGGDEELFKLVAFAEDTLCGPGRADHDAWLRDVWDPQQARDAAAAREAARRADRESGSSGTTRVEWAGGSMTVSGLSGHVVYGGVRREFSSPEEMAAALRGDDIYLSVRVFEWQWREGLTVRTPSGSVVEVPPHADQVLVYEGLGRPGVWGGRRGDLVLSLLVEPDPAPPPPVSAPVPPPADPGPPSAPARRSTARAFLDGTLTLLRWLAVVGVICVATAVFWWFSTRS